MSRRTPKEVRASKRLAVTAKKRRLYREMLDQAKTVGKASFWLSKFIDFRGRFYNTASSLDYVSNKSARSLVDFAGEHPPAVDVLLDDMGKSIVALGVDYDKALPNVRMEFVKLHIDTILAHGADPKHAYTSGQLGDWTGDSLDYLAKAINLHKVITLGEKSSGKVVFMDMTCSGLQILGAIAGDVATMTETNVCEYKGSRGDIYITGVDWIHSNFATLADFDQLVNAKGKPSNVDFVHEPTGQAVIINDVYEYIIEHMSSLVVRKTTKLGLMSLGYGSADSTVRADVVSKLDWLDSGVNDAFDNTIRKVVGDMVVLMRRKVVDKPMLVMAFFQNLQKAAGDAALSFAMDDGFSWSNYYPEMDGSMNLDYLVSDISEGCSIDDEGSYWNDAGLRIDGAGFAVDKKGKLVEGKHYRLDESGQRVLKSTTARMQSAIAPNTVHAIDSELARSLAFRAAHLNMPVQMVHDAFGTTSNNVDEMLSELHGIFIKQFLGRNRMLEMVNMNRSVLSTEDHTELVQQANNLWTGHALTPEGLANATAEDIAANTALEASANNPIMFS